MRPSTAPLLLLVAASAILLSSLPSTLAQNSDASPVGPLTTNNGKPACVQFGDCTTASGSISTATFNSAITSPASVPNIAQPTNSVQSLNAASAFASQGAAAAFSSRVANGQPTGAGAADGSTTIPIGTDATVFALTSSAGASSASRSASASGSATPNAAASSQAVNVAALASLAVAAVAAVAGGALVL